MSSSVVTKVICFAGVLSVAGGAVHGPSAEENGRSTICRPQPAEAATIELGMAGQFKWTCSDGKNEGNGYYVVFIRPDGRFVLLKVPVGRSSFEFTPDAAGLWRWLVINTDPDRTKPDMESEPGYFHVVMPQESSK
ncbi:MAG: hypothetical protein V1792_07425 [Pseudomonadota bacterium]